MSNPFHLAIPVNDLALAADFYENTLGCQRGRETESWIDFNLFGHQLVCHFVTTSSQEYLNPVDGDSSHPASLTVRRLTECPRRCRRGRPRATRSHTTPPCSRLDRRVGFPYLCRFVASSKGLCHCRHCAWPPAWVRCFRRSSCTSQSGHQESPSACPRECSSRGHRCPSMGTKLSLIHI